jgi:L,D-transpeptidase ErfK/SrfK
MRCGRYLCVLLLALLCAIPVRATELEPARALSASESQYVVQNGDSFASIGSRFGVEPPVLAQVNRLNPKARLQPGSIIWVDNRHIVPDGIKDGILINIPQRMLFFFNSGVLTAAYPVALGRPTWRTPQGDFTVVETRADPIWTVPKSIQREMAQQGKEVKTKVAPGPDNPLGGYWIGLSMPALGIHGTTAPRSIYRFRSHGCIRLHPADAAKLFPMVTVGTPVRIIYEPVLLAHLDDGRIFVEANPDIYGLAPHALDDLQTLAVSNHIGNMIDWQRVREGLERKDGLARDVTSRIATPILSTSSLSPILSPVFWILHRERASTPSRPTRWRSVRGRSRGWLSGCAARCRAARFPRPLPMRPFGCFFPARPSLGASPTNGTFFVLPDRVKRRWL